MKTGARMRGMGKAKKPYHMKVGKIDATIRVGENTNKVHIDMMLSVDQESRLLNLLEKRKTRRGKR